MSAATVLEQIHTLPAGERDRLFDALWQESRQAWLERMEDEQDSRDAEAVLNDPQAEFVPWADVKQSLGWK